MSKSEGKKQHAVPIQQALDSYFDRQGMKRRIRQASVVPEWAELVGPQISEVARPREVLRDGTLIVTVKSAAWMQELQLMSPEILRQLGRRGKGIRRILWKAE